MSSLAHEKKKHLPKKGRKKAISFLLPFIVLSMKQFAPFGNQPHPLGT